MSGTKEIMTKKLSIRFFINFAFTFILLSLFLICIYQNSMGGPLTGNSLFKQFCTKVYTPVRVWREGIIYGDISAYSIFLKENIFKEDFYGHVLVMSGLDETNPDRFLTFHPEFLSFYLFPVKIEIDNSYKFVLDEMAFNKLRKLPLITRMYGETDKNHLTKRYCLVRGIEVKDYKKWAVYVFPTKEAINIFTLPIGWQGVQGSN